MQKGTQPQKVITPLSEGWALHPLITTCPSLTHPKTDTLSFSTQLGLLCPALELLKSWQLECFCLIGWC